MKLDTLMFFNELLARVSLPASAPDFEEQAARISAARSDLAEAIKAAEAEVPPPPS